MRFWIIVAFLVLAIPSCMAHAGEPGYYSGTVVMEFDGNSTDNVLGYCLNVQGTTFDLVVSRDADTAWLKLHLGLPVKVKGNRGSRGDRSYLFVQELKCQPSSQENK